MIALLTILAAIVSIIVCAAGAKLKELNKAQAQRTAEENKRNVMRLTALDAQAAMGQILTEVAKGEGLRNPDLEAKCDLISLSFEIETDQIDPFDNMGWN